jgi:hypothetical protein
MTALVYLSALTLYVVVSMLDELLQHDLSRYKDLLLLLLNCSLLSLLLQNYNTYTVNTGGNSSSYPGVSGHNQQ